MEEKLEQLEKICRDYPDKKFGKLIYNLFAAVGLPPHLCTVKEPVTDVFVVSWIDKEAKILESKVVDLRDAENNETL